MKWNSFTFSKLCNFDSFLFLGQKCGPMRNSGRGALRVRVGRGSHPGPALAVGLG